MQRIRSLDGIRGISIIMVLLAHGMYSLPKPVTTNVVYSLLAESHIGVMIFFVISGYLITKLLLIEKEKKGAISIRDFYLRRIFRIFPVFYLFILVVVLLKVTISPTIYSDTWTIIYASLHLWNYQHLLYFIHSLNEKNGYWFLGHFWSLAMEEQFYLIWPFVFRRFGTTSLKKGIVVILLLMPIVRFSSYFLFPNSRGQIDMMLHTGGGMILMGCLGALLETSESFMLRLKRLLENKWMAAFAFLYLFVINWLLSVQFRGAYWLPIGHPATSICILFLLFWCIYIPSPVQNFLNSGWIKQVGVLSYSLYIWQQLIFTDIYSGYIHTFPLNFVLVFVAALISYHFVELPFIRLKKRFERIKIKDIEEEPVAGQDTA